MDQLNQYSASPERVASLSGQAGVEAEDRDSGEPAHPETRMHPLRFPGEDDGRSLAEMAKRDLDAALQLLAERAQHITGASGATIALGQGEALTCRASSGPSAPKVGALIDISAGLSAESLRTRQVLRCHDTATDPRVDGKGCHALNILSVMVMPLIRERGTIGIFELLSAKAHAFGERDIAALERLGEMIQTAVDHAEGAANAQTAMQQGSSVASKEAAAAAPPGSPEQTIARAQQASADPDAPKEDLAIALAPSPWEERGNIGKCGSCGFPVSEGRSLCLDCDPSHTQASPGQGVIPSFLSGEDSTGDGNRSWPSSHVYLVGTVIVAAATLAIALWLRLI